MNLPSLFSQPYLEASKFHVFFSVTSPEILSWLFRYFSRFINKKILKKYQELSPFICFSFPLFQPSQCLFFRPLVEKIDGFLLNIYIRFVFEWGKKAKMRIGRRMNLKRQEDNENMSFQYGFFV